MKNAFTTVKIKCRPVVKSFLEKNFGNPVTIPEHHILNKLVNSQLTKDNARFDRYQEYSDTIEIKLSKENFRFDGFTVNDMNTQRFNNGVSNYIKHIYCTNIDALLISQEKQKMWKESYFKLLKDIGDTLPFTVTDTTIKKLKKELSDHEIDIKEAIKIVVEKFLKLDPEEIPYETIKKGYYRYRLEKLTLIN